MLVLPILLIFFDDMSVLLMQLQITINVSFTEYSLIETDWIRTAFPQVTQIQQQMKVVS